MKIEFPCPAKSSEFIPTTGRAFCSHCSKEVVDVDGMTMDEVRELSMNSEDLCVSTSNPAFVEFGPSLRKFALSLLVVFGSSLFTFADAQIAESIEKITTKEPVGASIAMMQIVFVSQSGDTLSTSIDVTVELPNGKEIKPTIQDDGTYWIEVPLYAKGKNVIVHSDRFGKKKSRSVYVSGLGEALIVEIKYKLKKAKFNGRWIGCPSF